MAGQVHDGAGQDKYLVLLDMNGTVVRCAANEDQNRLLARTGAAEPEGRMLHGPSTLSPPLDMTPDKGPWPFISVDASPLGPSHCSASALRSQFGE